MDDSVRKMLEEKYSEQLNNIGVGQAFANLGDVIAGRQVGSTSPFFTEQRSLAKDQTLGQYDRQQALEMKKAKEAQDLQMRLMQLEQQKEISKQNLDIKKLLAEGKIEQAKLTRDQLKALPATQAEALGDANASTLALNQAMDTFKANQDLAGPWQGRVSEVAAMGEMGDVGKRAKAFDAQLKINAQTIGKYLEGGKLTDADIDRYRKMLPSLTDSFDVAKQKTDLLNNMLSQKQAAQKEALLQAGYKVGDIRISKPTVPKIKQGERRSYQGKTYELVGPDRNDPNSWKVVGE